MFHMSRQLRCVVSLLLVVIAAAQTAIAAPVDVSLAEKTPVDPGAPTMTLAGPFTTTTTTTTATTLPTIPKCPDSIAGAEGGSRLGSDYWRFDDEDVCKDPWGENSVKIYCFENPAADFARSDLVVWKDVTYELLGVVRTARRRNG